MTKEFNRDGLSFSWPDDWSVEREEQKDGWTISLQSPGTAFAVVRLDRSMPATEEVAQTTLDALKEDYPHLEATATVDMLAGEMAIGHDIQFFSLDFATTCWTRSFYGAAGTVLVLCQVSDIDQEIYEPVLRGICDSLRSSSEEMN